MARKRISTTVDGVRLERARALAGAPDAEWIDRAIALYIEVMEGEHERAALREQPYHLDPELDLPPAAAAAAADALPYDGEVPADVLALARRRRGG